MAGDFDISAHRLEREYCYESSLKIKTAHYYNVIISVMK